MSEHLLIAAVDTQNIFKSLSTPLKKQGSSDISILSSDLLNKNLSHVDFDNNSHTR
jgi:hypothetical protein